MGRGRVVGGPEAGRDDGGDEITSDSEGVTKVDFSPLSSGSL